MFKKEDYFMRNDDFNSLKALVEALIKYESGKWSSPGGEAKMFKRKNFSLKWYGPKKRTLIIVEDNEEKLLRNTLGTYAQEIKSETHHKNNSKCQSTWPTASKTNNQNRSHLTLSTLHHCM